VLILCRIIIFLKPNDQIMVHSFLKRLRKKL